MILKTRKNKKQIIKIKNSMKKQIEITTERNFPVSKNFERKVKKLMPDKVKEIHIHIPRMIWEGYGQYRYEANIFVNYQKIKLTQRTTDSISYDNYKDIHHYSKKYNDWCKNVILHLLEYRIEKIVEFINQNTDE